MAPDDQGAGTPDEKPQRLGGSSPPDYGQAVGIGHVVEMLMQMQQTLGGVKSDVGHLKDGMEGFGQRLSRVEKVVWCAIGGVAVLIAVALLVLRPLISALVERVMNGGAH